MGTRSWGASVLDYVGNAAGVPLPTVPVGFLARGLSVVGSEEITFLKMLETAPQMTVTRWAVRKCPWSLLLPCSPWRMTLAIGFALFLYFYHLQVRCTDGPALPAFLALKGWLLLTRLATP